MTAVVVVGATSPEALLARVRGYVSEGVRLSTIGFGTGSYRDQMMEQLANDGNGNYFYIDSPRQAERVFELGFDGMIQDVARPIDRAPEDFRFAVAVMGAAELLRNSPYAEAWSFDRVLNLLADSKNTDPDREELVALLQSARAASAVPPAKLSSIVRSDPRTRKR